MRCQTDLIQEKGGLTDSIMHGDERIRRRIKLDHIFRTHSSRAGWELGLTTDAQSWKGSDVLRAPARRMMSQMIIHGL